MNRPSNTGLVLVIIVALAAAVLALRPTVTETEVLPPVNLPDPGEEPAAVVVALRESGGFSLLGLTLGEVTRTVTVQFYAPAGCYEQLTTGDSWPAPSPVCTGPVSIEGTVSGGGIAATGESIVAVNVIVTEDCFASIAAGDNWPPPVCTSGLAR